MSEQRYEDMRAELMRLTVGQLREVCCEEGVCPGYEASRKSSLVDAIVTHRRHAELEAAREARKMGTV